MGVTQYKRLAYNDELPAYASCITAVRYLIRKTTGLRLPNVWVADIPYAMTLKNWRAVVIDKDQLRSGDLLFTCRWNQITHVAIAIDANRIFHCAFDRERLLTGARNFYKSIPLHSKLP